MANKRLIDANALLELENLDYVYDPVRDGCEWYRAADVWSCIEREPTVDAVEVVHGWWHKPTPCSQEFCTNCGLTPKTNFGWLPPYCPNCGAKMDGGNEDGNL